MLGRGSLARRLVAASLAWIVLTVLVGGVALSLAFRSALGAADDARLEAWLRALVASIRVEPGGGIGLARSLGDPRFEQVFSGLYWQIEEGGRVVAASRSLWDARLSLPEESTPNSVGPVSGGTLRASVEGPRRQRLRVVTELVTLPDRELPLRVAIAADDEEGRRAVARLDALLATSLGLLAAGLGAALVAQVRFGLRPLSRLARALEAVRSGERERLPEDGPHELAPLVGSLNALLDDESERLRRARAQAGNLAHALRTPLSLLALEADAIPGEAGDALRRRLSVVRAEIEQRMARAAIAGPLAVRGARTQLAEAAGAIADTLRRLFPERTIEVEIPEGLAFRGDREDLIEIVGNLAENACKWARRCVRITAEEAEEGSLVLRVDDDGPGLGAEATTRAVERGVRLDERTPGAGLGLSIVSEIATAHGGSMRLAASPLGGLRAEVLLPAVPASTAARA